MKNFNESENTKDLCNTENIESARSAQTDIFSENSKKSKSAKKKIILIVCSLIIIIVGFTILLSRQEGDFENISWTYENKVLTISGVGKMPEADEYPWWKYADKAEEIIICEGVTSVSEEAFIYFLEAKKVTIPDSVETIGHGAFEVCHLLKDVDLGNGVKIIGRGVFMGCLSLESINIPDSTEVIEGGAFNHCEKLKSVNIGKGLKKIELDPFYDVAEGVVFSISEENPHIICENDVFFTKDKSTLIYYFSGKKDECYTIPEGVESVGYRAFFQNESLRKVDFPSTLKVIDEFAFLGASIEIAHVPDGVEEIKRGAFSGCGKLEAVYIGKGVSSIIDGAFSFGESLSDFFVSEENLYYSSVEGILFNKDKTELIAFPANKTAYYTVPESVVKIHADCFDYSQLVEIIIPKTVCEIGEEAFGRCKRLEKITYGGTKEQWQKFTEDIYYNTNEHKVICSDGELTF
jgi:hypothetical protein